MSFDKRFFGIYRGVIYDSTDPESKGRARIQVPQVLGTSITDWVEPIIGNTAQLNYPYGTFITTTTQALTQNAASVVSNWQAEDVNKVYLNGTKIYVEESGDYFFQFSVVFSKTTANPGDADIWIRKNGADIANSNTTVHLSGSDAESLATVGFILDLDAGDYVELVASTSSTNTIIKYHPIGTTPTRPAIPGVIATINLIGKYRPRPNTPIWVMFEGGDPNFPLWIGSVA